EMGAQLADHLALPAPLELRALEMPDRGQRPCRDGGGQGSGEDEARGEGAEEIAEVGRAGDVAADDAEGLAERALDQRYPVHQAEFLGDAAAPRPVEPDGVNLVEIGHRPVFLGNLDDL